MVAGEQRGGGSGAALLHEVHKGVLPRYCGTRLCLGSLYHHILLDACCARKVRL